MCPRKAENVLGTLTAWEGITSASAVLEQVSGNSLRHGGRAPTQPSGLQPRGNGLSLLYFVAQRKKQAAESGKRKKRKLKIGFFKWKVAVS